MINSFDKYFSKIENLIGPEGKTKRLIRRKKKIMKLMFDGYSVISESDIDDLSGVEKIITSTHMRTIRRRLFKLVELFVSRLGDHLTTEELIQIKHLSWDIDLDMELDLLVVSWCDAFMKVHESTLDSNIVFSHPFKMDIRILNSLKGKDLEKFLRVYSKIYEDGIDKVPNHTGEHAIFRHETTTVLHNIEEEHILKYHKYLRLDSLWDHPKFEMTDSVELFIRYGG